MILQLSEFMHDQIVGIITSRKEIGTVHETYVYVRFPYYIAMRVKSLSIGVNEASVGSHKFKASVCYEGRHDMPRALPQIDQWELCIGGRKVPELTKEELSRVTAKPEGTWESRWQERERAKQQNIMVSRSLKDNSQEQATVDYLHGFEIDYIHNLHLL